MKRYLIIKAYSTSDVMVCNYCLVEMNESFLGLIESFKPVASVLKSMNQDFCELRFKFEDIRFYNTLRLAKVVEDFFNKDKSYEVVMMSPMTVNTLSSVESTESNAFSAILDKYMLIGDKGVVLQGVSDNGDLYTSEIFKWNY